MCGIFGYIGKRKAALMALEGLKLLEYRGYDSTGIAGIKAGVPHILFCKQSGKVAQLQQKMQVMGLDIDLCISHTRWATHGIPSYENSHPHFDVSNRIALVHNGIIENYQELKKQFSESLFVSQTDTEVVAHLLAREYQGDFLQAAFDVFKQLKGSFALAMIHADHPGQIIVTAHDCPLVIGVGAGEVFVASDPGAFSQYVQQVIYLNNDQVALLQEGKVALFAKDGAPLPLVFSTVDTSIQREGRDHFDHFMLKEICQQPQTLRATLQGRIEGGKVLFTELAHLSDSLKKITQVRLIGCGTSWHAGCLGAMNIEEIVGIPALCDIASEVRYRQPVVPENTLIIALSQSGETADTIAALRYFKEKGFLTLGLCNISHSTLAREVDGCLLLKTGQEVGVASTKTFTAQLALLILLSLYLRQIKGQIEQGPSSFLLLQGLQSLPLQLEYLLGLKEEIWQVSAKYSRFEHFIFLGRQQMFPTCLEAALKLKEISYIHASGYTAGEMKHGPIALVDPECPTVAFCANSTTLEKMIGNLMEVKARKGPILGIAYNNLEIQTLKEICDDLILIPQTIDSLAPITASLIGQLLAYEIAKKRGADIDQPRNLAKSVTVE